MNQLNHVTQFRDEKGNWLKFKTKTRGAKGTNSKPKPDPIDTHEYGTLHRNKKTGELAVGFFGGRTGSSNSVKPSTLHFDPEDGPTHSSNDPWAAHIAAQKAQEAAIIKLSQYRLLVGKATGFECKITKAVVWASTGKPDTDNPNCSLDLDASTYSMKQLQKGILTGFEESTSCFNSTLAKC